MADWFFMMPIGWLCERTAISTSSSPSSARYVKCAETQRKNVKSANAKEKPFKDARKKFSLDRTGDCFNNDNEPCDGTLVIVLGVVVVDVAVDMVVPEANETLPRGEGGGEVPLLLESDEFDELFDELVNVALAAACMLHGWNGLEAEAE